MVTHRLNPASGVYNVRIALRFQGALDVPALERSLSELVRRHEALRARFDERDGLPVQTIVPRAEIPLTLMSLERQPTERVSRVLTEETIRPFDLSRDPLLRAVLIRIADDDHILCLTTHHIVTDGWSMAILSSRLHADLPESDIGLRIVIAGVAVSVCRLRCLGTGKLYSSGTRAASRILAHAIGWIHAASYLPARPEAAFGATGRMQSFTLDAGSSHASSKRSAVRKVSRFS